MLNAEGGNVHQEGFLKLGTALALEPCSPSPLQGKVDEAESGFGQCVGAGFLK